MDKSSAALTWRLFLFLGKMKLLLLLLAFFLLPRAEAGEIIGGHEAKPHSHPYMAYLRIRREKSRKVCGGFLIQEDFVLTAAHCLKGQIKVTLGAHNIKEQEDTQQVFRVQKAFPHQDFNWEKRINDIMLLKLKKKAKLTNAVQLLNLPKGMTQGDSGGPLVCNNMAQGIVSYAGKNRTTPIIFTKVSWFLSWIKKTMKQS
ncbi:mast cell protease 3-like [Cavia porcellus]|uniref:mast cell protease 3-like n=1 Tax=Cavia porcellus TaxID=10141 RepID=UPI000661E068